MSKTYEYNKLSKGNSVEGPRSAPSSSWMGAKSYIVVATRICPVCGEEYKRYKDEIEYTVLLTDKEHILCSYNCKRKFMREHERELEKMKEELDDGYYSMRESRGRRHSPLRKNKTRGVSKN